MIDGGSFDGQACRVSFKILIETRHVVWVWLNGVANTVANQSVKE